MSLSDFDLDFSNGREGETLVEALLTGGKTVEVKRDLRWHETENLYIETSCYYQRSKSWEASGLSTTKADYWAFVLCGGVLMIPTTVLKTAVFLYGRQIRCNIEPNPSAGYLVTANEILTALARHGNAL